MENLDLEVKQQFNESLLFGINKFGDYRAARLFDGKWYSVYSCKNGVIMQFEEISEFFVKNFLYFFDGSGLLIDENICAKMSSFLTNGIRKHLQAKANMEKFFNQLENSKA